MLTEKEKNHLKAEEIFRIEVRKSLEQQEKKTFWQKVWKLVNSTFGLWLLSTVVVGLVVSFYSDFRVERDIDSKNVETMRKQSTEVSGRLQKFRTSLLELPSDEYHSYRYTELAHMIDGTGVIDQGSASPERPIFVFPEYKDRTMQSLLYEMEGLTKDKKQAATIKDGRIIISRIQNALTTMKNEPRPDHYLSQRLSQIVQGDPNAKLSPQDSIEMVRYKQYMAIYNQQLAGYHNRTKITLDSLGKELLKNTFLKKESND